MLLSQTQSVFWANDAPMETRAKIQTDNEKTLSHMVSVVTTRGLVLSRAGPFSFIFKCLRCFMLIYVRMDLWKLEEPPTELGEPGQKNRRTWLRQNLDRRIEEPGFARTLTEEYENNEN